jgi:hypothetical protein
MSQDLVKIQQLIDSAMASLKTAESMLRKTTGVSNPLTEDHVAKAKDVADQAPIGEGKVVYGIFDGQTMIDQEGNTYPIPANYASKSKLVETDKMKLTITEEGKFLYKQIEQVPRKSVVGVLIQEDGQYKVLSDGKSYRILMASITFYRAEIGDQVTVLLPAEGDAHWGAVDGVIPKAIAEKQAEDIVSEAMEDGELAPKIEK